MADNLLSDRPDYGRTFNSVMWVVGTLAATMFFAAAIEMLRRPPVDPAAAEPVVSGNRPVAPLQPPLEGNERSGREQQANGNAVNLPPGEMLSSSPRDPEDAIKNGYSGMAQEGLRSLVPGNVGGRAKSGEAGSETATRSLSQPSILPEPSFAGPATADRSLSESLSAAKGSVAGIDDLVSDRLMAAGEELRAAGNPMGALDAFKKVEAGLPDHPRVLGEIAATYSQLGRGSDAMLYWARIVDLGPVSAGEYFAIAKGILEGDQVPVAGSTAQQMKIGEVIVNEEPPGEGGQKVSLRVIVDGNPANSPSGSDLALAVYFYDIVNGQTIEASTADTSKLYPTEPYDWKVDGTEEIVVNYHQPVFSEEQARELGERRYYGYAIELYYKDQLQDKVTMPEEIAALRIQETPPLEEPAPVFIGPDNALFPDPLTP